MDTFLKVLEIIFIIVFAMALSLGIWSGIIYLICLCFDLTFSWKIAIGIWLVSLLVGSVFKTTTNNN